MEKKNKRGHIKKKGMIWDWAKQKFFDMVYYDYWKQKSQFAVRMLMITFIISIISLIFVIYLYFSSSETTDKEYYEINDIDYEYAWT